MIAVWSGGMSTREHFEIFIPKMPFLSFVSHGFTTKFNCEEHKFHVSPTDCPNASLKIARKRPFMSKFGGGGGSCPLVPLPRASLAVHLGESCGFLDVQGEASCP